VRTAAFLAARELRRRWGRAVLAAAVVAGAVALAVGLELLGRARERGVEAQLDAAGPALRVVPAGVSAGDVAALRLGTAALPDGAAAQVRAVLGDAARRVEGRVLLRDPATGVAIVAVAEPRDREPLSPGRVLIGTGLAERGARAGETIALVGRTFTIAGVSPSNADATDHAVRVLASDFGAVASNELQVFLAPGVRPQEAERTLRAALPAVTVLRTDRGEVADGGLQGTIAAHRRAVQLVTALVAALALLIATHLDVAERRRELALLASVGMTRGALAGVVVLRAMGCALVGGVVGVGLATGLAAAQPEFHGGPVPAIAAAAVLFTTCVAALAAAPIALASAQRDPVAELQES
jgi:putative ABC transport system permease protein